MEKIVFIDMNALFPTLFWGNVISVIFLALYYTSNRSGREKQISLLLIGARLCHAFHYCVVSGRGILPDWLSVNAGITLLYAGCYLEAQAILRILRENTVFTNRLLTFILVLFAAAFNIVELAFPLGGIRITMASMGNVSIMALPVFRMLIARESKAHIKPAAILYTVFLALLLVRAWYGLQNRDMSILTTNILQSLTFLSLLLQIMIALPSYTLIIKDYSDKALILMATTDRLTGATNRHAFINASGAVFENCKRRGLPLTVMFLDIDLFKTVNDRFGHLFGDKVLARLSSCIDRCLRGSDLSCRYGGEEFVIMLQGADRGAANIVAERILSEVRRERFKEHPDFSFTVSIGISCGIPPDISDFDSMLRMADEAMYQAKKEGRDRCVLREA